MGGTSQKLAPIAMVIGLLAGFSAAAQPVPGQDVRGHPPMGQSFYDVKTMTFYSWCQQTQGYETERCEKRLPADVQAFETYRASIERYELQFLKQNDADERARARGNVDPSSAVRARQDAPL